MTHEKGTTLPKEKKERLAEEYLDSYNVQIGIHG